MAITSGINIVFKKDVMLEQHNLPSDTLRIALVSASGSASNGGPDTIASISGQISGTSDGSGGSGYVTGVTVSNVSSSGVVDFSDVSFTSVTFTARGAILYNETNSNKVIAVYDFGGDKAVTNGTFQLTIPSATSAAAIVRLN